MKRLAMLGATALIGALPSVASARSHFFFGFNFGVPVFGGGYYRPYCYAPCYRYTYIAPPVVYYSPAPTVVYTSPPPVVYSAPPPVVYAPPPTTYIAPPQATYVPAPASSTTYYYYGSSPSTTYYGGSGNDGR